MAISIQRLLTALSLPYSTSFNTTEFLDPPTIKRVLNEARRNDEALSLKEVNSEKINPNTFTKITYLFRLTFEQKAFEYPDFWKPFALTISMVALGVLAIRPLRSAYQAFINRKIAEWTDYAKGYVITTRENGRAISRRAATYQDVMPDYSVYVKVGALVYGFVIMVFAALTWRAVQKCQFYKFTVTPIEQVPVERPSNSAENGFWLDPISFDSIPSEKVNTPHTLHLPPYLFDLKSFERSLMYRTTFSHPYLARDFTDEERDIVLQHLCTFYQCGKEEFLELWEDGKATIGEKKELIRQHREEIHQELLELPLFDMLVSVIKQLTFNHVVSPILTFSTGTENSKIGETEKSLKAAAKECYEDLKVCAEISSCFYYPPLRFDLLEWRGTAIFQRVGIFGELTFNTIEIPPPPLPSCYTERTLCPEETRVWTFFDHVFDWKSWSVLRLGDGSNEIEIPYQRHSALLYYGFLSDIAQSASIEVMQNNPAAWKVLMQIQKMIKEVEPYMEQEMEPILNQAALNALGDMTPAFHRLLEDFEKEKRYRLFCELADVANT